MSRERERAALPLRGAIDPVAHRAGARQGRSRMGPDQRREHLAAARGEGLEGLALCRPHGAEPV